MITNNRFTRDSIADRLARLDAVQTTWAAVAVLLAPVPADLALWAATCSTDYLDLRDDFNAKTNVEEGATAARDAAEKVMDADYSAARTMGAGFSWTAVGETIRLEASYDGGMTWNEIAFGVNPSGTYNWTPPAGMFRIRREAGGIVGPWSVITVTTP